MENFVGQEAETGIKEIRKELLKERQHIQRRDIKMILVLE